MLINVKMPTFCWHFNILSMINTTSKSLKVRKVFIFQHFSFHKLLKFHAQLSWAWKVFFITFGSGLLEEVWTLSLVASYSTRLLWTPQMLIHEKSINKKNISLMWWFYYLQCAERCRWLQILGYWKRYLPQQEQDLPHLGRRRGPS